MATGKYHKTHPTVVNATAGDPSTGTVWNKGWVDDDDVETNASFDLIEDDMTALQNASMLQTDNSVVAWKDAATVTIKAGSQWIDTTGTRFYTVQSDTDVVVPDDLSADATGSPTLQNSTLYSLYGGEDINGDLCYYVSDLTSALPGELEYGARIRGAIRIDASGDIVPFYFCDNWYWYDVALACDGSDETEILDVTSSGYTSFADVDCGTFVPEGDRRCHIYYYGSQTFNLAWRRDGQSHDGVQIDPDDQYIRPLAVDCIDGLFEFKTVSGQAVRMSVMGFQL